MAKIKKGDEVVVTAGKDKGRTGTVTAVMPGKVIVGEVNVMKKHQKGNPQQGQPGGVIDQSMPLDISNVALYNPMTKKADRVGYKILEDGTKVRYFKSNNEVVDV